MSGVEKTAPARIVSMDQFRGYTVAGMLLVNFLGEYAAVHTVFKHNNNYFSYADSIMPSFMFACGFSYRLTVARGVARGNTTGVYRRLVGRSLGLVLLSLTLSGFGHTYDHWSEITANSAAHLLARLVKADLWEVLAIIGVGQLLILPIISKGPATRAAAFILLLVLHLILSYSFNFDFVFGRPNRLDDWAGTSGTTAWDGGCFGLLPWSALMLAGSIVFDLMASGTSPGRASTKLITVGLVLAGIGYGFSCLSLLYQGEQPSGAGGTPASPVLPPVARAWGRPWAELLSEPPLVAPPSDRPNNYWMMNKRAVSLPFALFATGWATAVYGLFVLACDAGSLRVGVFRTFGQNALAAYVLHHLVSDQVHHLVPGDAPLAACLGGLVVFFTVTYVFVRYLEKQGVHIRL